MNVKKLGLAIIGFVCLQAGALNAEDMVWTGAANSSWDTSTLNWSNGGASAAFTPGADVRFDDTATSFTVTLTGEQQAGQMVFTNDTDYTLAGSKLAETALFVKQGAGEVTITGTGHTYTGDMLIENGVLTVTADNDASDVTSGPLGNPRAPRVITVTTNGTLNFVGKNPFGGGTSGTPVLTDLRIIGGTLNLTTNFGNNFGSLLFDNATINYYSGYKNLTPGGRNWAMLNIGSNATFKGETPYVFDQRGPVQCQINMGKHRPTELWVDDITGDDAADVTFAIPVFNVATPTTGGFTTRFDKYGPGTLVLSSTLNDFTGAVHVVEGTLTAAANYTSLTAVNSVMGNPRVHHQFFVETNATLVFAKSDILGQAWANPQIEIVVSGGTLVQSNHVTNVFGPLTLDNASLVYSGQNGNWGTLVFDGDVTFRGTNAYNLAAVDGSNIRCGYNRMTYFEVADIPGTNIDVTIGMQINDCQAWVNGGLPARPSRFGKRGPGTLRLDNQGSNFTGDVEVAEGVLQVPFGSAVENRTYSCIGNPQTATREIRVQSGGELYFMRSDTLGQLASSVKMGTVISNGTLRLANYTCNGFGPLTLCNAKVIYNSGTSSSRIWGVMGLGGKTVFAGTNAYTFAVVGSNCRFSLGYGTDFYAEENGSTTNYHGKTEFVVRDITTNAATDVTFEVPLQDIPDWSGATLFKNVLFKCGLLKSGDGTLCLASTDNTYTDPTVVTQGVLRVDGSLTASAVTVEAGGGLGGTGTVSNVTLKDGARFDVFANQTEPLKVDTLTLEGGGTIVVHNPTGLDPTTLRAPFLRVTGSLTGTFSKSAWTVLMDGVETTPSLNVGVAGDGTVYAKWAPPGLLIKVY